MEQLIKIKTNEQGEQLVDARELYQFLEVKTDFKDWIKRMLEYGFDEGTDFSSFLSESKGGRPSKDYALTLDTAKEISMLQRSEKGKQARQYFIACEKALKEVSQYKIPKTFKEALLLAVEQQNIIEKQETLLIEQKPKVEFYDEIIDAKETFDMAETAKLLKFKYGRNTLFQKLKSAKVLMKDNEPYQQYVGNYFIIVESKWNNPTTGTSHIAKVTRTTQKGLDWLQKNKQKFNL